MASNSFSRARCLSNVVGQSMHEQFARGVTSMAECVFFLVVPDFALFLALRIVAKVLPSSKQRLHTLHFCARAKESFCAFPNCPIAKITDLVKLHLHSKQMEALDRELALHFNPQIEHLSLPKNVEIITLL